MRPIPFTDRSGTEVAVNADRVLYLKALPSNRTRLVFGPAVALDVVGTITETADKLGRVGP